MAAPLKRKVEAAAGLLLVLFASSMMVAAAAKEEFGDEGRLQLEICSLCLSKNCEHGYCSSKCPGLCPAVAREERAGEEEPLRQPDYYCVLCWHKRCPASCRSGCTRYCGRASTE